MEDFGQMNFRASVRLRSIRVRILPDKLEVGYPVSVPLARVHDFLQANKTRILAKQQALRLRTPSPTLLAPGHPLQTLTFKVDFRADAVLGKVHAHFSPGMLLLAYPASADVATLQDAFWHTISHYLRSEAQRVLPMRTAQLAAQHGFTFRSVAVRASRSRWGSCSAQKHINFSIYLLLAPQHLVDYVVLHELCHTVEMNHGPRFWALLDGCTQGRAKALRTELKAVKMPLK